MIQLHSLVFHHSVDDAGNAFDYAALLSSVEFREFREFRSSTVAVVVMCAFVLNVMVNYWRLKLQEVVDYYAAVERR